MEVSGTSACVNVNVPLDALETTMLLQTAVGSLLSLEYKRWRTFTETVNRCFVTKGHLVITLAKKDHLGIAPGARVEYRDAPAACKARVNGVLSFYVPVGTDLEKSDVTLLAA